MPCVFRLGPHGVCRLADACVKALADAAVSSTRQLASLTYDKLGLGKVSGGVAATLSEALAEAADLKNLAKKAQQAHDVGVPGEILSTGVLC